MPAITLLLLGEKKKICEQIQFLAYYSKKSNQILEHVSENILWVEQMAHAKYKNEIQKDKDLKMQRLNPKIKIEQTFTYIFSIFFIFKHMYAIIHNGQ